MIAAALLAAYFFFSGGGGFAGQLFGKDSEAAVREIVKDKTRAAAAAQVIAQGRSDLEATAKRFGEVAQDFVKTDKQQSAGFGELEPFMKRTFEERRVEQKQSLDRFFELRSKLTRDEWTAYFARLKK
jgi:hypothetical protein